MEVTLCLIPSELFALAWLPFSLASAPWAANYLGLVFILEYEGHSFRTFQLSDLWSGFSSLGSKIVLYFQILLSPSLPLRVTSKKGMEWEFKMYCQFNQAFKLYLNSGIIISH